jgi:hypothetical protein
MLVATCHNHPVTTASHPFGLILLIHHICICLLFTLAARNLEKASVPLAHLKLFSIDKIYYIRSRWIWQCYRWPAMSSCSV